MWLKYFFIVVIFYFFAILQNSFFVHYSLFGAVPNLIFILFLLLIFFGKQYINYLIIFYSIIAGLLLDIFSSGYIGVSVIFLIIIGFLIKKLHSLLSEKNDKYSFMYFLLLFIISFVGFNLCLAIYFYFLNSAGEMISFNWSFVFDLIYNLFFGSVIFWIYKKFIEDRFDNRQLPLFRR